MPRDVRVYLHDVKSAGDEILDYTQGMAFEQYRTDGKTRRAVERCLAIIGEALVQARQKGLTDVEHLPRVQSVIDLRNFLVHEYTKVKDEVIWQVLEQHLPVLLKAVDNLLESGTA
ncbi:MAG: HepT-like ribonuclease domain-containing protein [Janthinobacterium lividum]